jgi:hypothetical protein
VNSPICQFSIIRWNVLLIISETGGKYDHVVFGEVADASDGRDNYDAPKPILPPTPYLYAWFDAGLNEPYDTLQADYREYPDSDKIWDLYIQCNTSGPPIKNTHVTINWITQEVNDSEYATGVVVLYDCSDNSVVADMMRKSSYTFTATFDIQYHFRIQCNQIKPETYKISLNSNWNLISLPFNESKAKTSIQVKNNSIEYSWSEAVSHGIILNTFYYWNTTTSSYGISTSLKPGTGYWVYTYYNCSLLFTSTATTDVNLATLLTNWNTMGLPINTSKAKSTLLVRCDNYDYTWEQATTGGDPIILGFIYGWDRSNQMYILSDTFEPGNGYWMYGYKNCILKKGG